MNNSKRNSIVILAKNINLDKEYINILSYSENEMVTLCESNDHLVAKQTNYSFLKPNENIINVGIPYATCLQANYIAMQNPSYSNKWFFAFIDKVEYNSEASTNIYYTIDEMSTWWSYWTRKHCFVIREHVSNDTVGLHTIPEGLETGDYVIVGAQEDNLGSDLKIVMGSTVEVNDNINIGGGVYNGIPSGVCYYVYDSAGNYQETSTATLSGALRMLANHGKSSAVNCVFLAPSWLTPKMSGTVFVANTTSPITEYMFVSRINALDGYTPKNNKLLTSPYCGIVLSNNSGQATVYSQELWEVGDSGMTLVIKGALTPGCSIRCYPYNYKGVAENYDEGISLGKYPSLNWQTDTYTNWLTQNGISIGALKLNAIQSGYAKAGLETATGLVQASYGSPFGLENIAQGAGDVFGTMQEQYHHSFMTPTINGSINCGDVITSSGINKFRVLKMTIRAEFARSIDSYFTRYGYKVNELKDPNLNTRPYWNYIKIGNEEIIGTLNHYNNISIPESSMDVINKVFRKGTTIWHDHDNIGNYSLDNTIV